MDMKRLLTFLDDNGLADFTGGNEHIIADSFPLPEVEDMDDIVLLLMATLRSDERDCCDPKVIGQMNRILTGGDA